MRTLPQPVVFGGDEDRSTKHVPTTAGQKNVRALCRLDVAGVKRNEGPLPRVRLGRPGAAPRVLNHGATEGRCPHVAASARGPDKPFLFGQRPSHRRPLVAAVAVRFQSTPPRGGRPSYMGTMYGIFKFQSTPPRGGRRGCPRRSFSGQGFNPRPRVGGDRPGRWSRRSRWVSIHAPARGATMNAVTFSSLGLVSIHAPARGATGARTLRRGQSSCFNPRPRVGGDPRAAARAIRWARFNPRPRVGGDHRSARRWSCGPRFNPRPRVGGDLVGRVRTAKLVFRVSIHAPAWGATPRP